MSHTLQTRPLTSRLTSRFSAAGTIRNRSVSDTVLAAVVDIPAPPAKLTADWEREIAQNIGLEPGDVEALPMARARMRWPDYRQCVDTAAGWMASIGLGSVLLDAEIALMACRGARYHHDADQYGGAAFCNLFLSDKTGLDLHFPHAGYRIPLVKGTIVIFDTGQPHAVVDRQRGGYSAADFPADRDCSLVFLTWELPIEDVQLARALGITFDVPSSATACNNNEGLWRNGTPASVDADDGRWLDAGQP